MLAVGVLAALAGVSGGAPISAAEPPAAIEDGATPADADLPTDVVGAPVNRNLAPAHQLLFTQNDGSSIAATALSGTNTGLGPTDSATSQQTRAMVRREYPTSAGRFLDILRDSVLAFQMTQAGGQSLLQLIPSNAMAETSSAGWNQLTPVDTPSNGMTFVLNVGGEVDYELPVVNVGAATSGPLATQVAAQAGISGTPDYSGQWSVAGGAAGPAGLDGFSLISRADGLCLDVADQSDGSIAVVTAVCDGGSSQSWDYENDSGYGVLTNEEAGAGFAVTDWQPDTTAPLTVGGGLPFVVSFSQVVEPGPIAPSWSVLNPTGEATAP